METKMETIIISIDPVSFSTLVEATQSVGNNIFWGLIIFGFLYLITH